MSRVTCDYDSLVEVYGCFVERMTHAFTVNQAAMRETSQKQQTSRRRAVLLPIQAPNFDAGDIISSLRCLVSYVPIIYIHLESIYILSKRG
jgi:hypothetical protein